MSGSVGRSLLASAHPLNSKGRSTPISAHTPQPQTGSDPVRSLGLVIEHLAVRRQELWRLQAQEYDAELVAEIRGITKTLNGHESESSADDPLRKELRALRPRGLWGRKRIVPRFMGRRLFVVNRRGVVEIVERDDLLNPYRPDLRPDHTFWGGDPHEIMRGDLNYGRQRGGMAGGDGVPVDEELGDEYEYPSTKLGTEIASGVPNEARDERSPLNDSIPMGPEPNPWQDLSVQAHVAADYIHAGGVLIRQAGATGNKRGAPKRGILNHELVRQKLESHLGKSIDSATKAEIAVAVAQSYRDRPRPNRAVLAQLIGRDVSTVSRYIDRGEKTLTILHDKSPRGEGDDMPVLTVDERVAKLEEALTEIGRLGVRIAEMFPGNPTVLAVVHELFARTTREAEQIAA